VNGLDARRLRWPALLLIGVLVVACGPAIATLEPSGDANVSASPSTLAPTASATATTPSTATSPPIDPAGVTLRVNVLVDGLENPVDVTAPADAGGRLFVVEQPGRIRVVRDGKLLERPFLDIEERISSGGERGLLGLAFHPGFPADPRLFVDYTDRNGDTVVAEYRLDAQDEDIADRGSERILMRIAQPYSNHNGGAVAFGSDGMLYIAMGDGGSGGDPQGNGRRLDTLLAKILRIDVDDPPATTTPYRIPADNPFLGVADALPEIWLTGLRNPWRMRFDGETGDLWIGDVGQGSWEEIDVARAGTGGLDFGWNRMEGFHCFESGAGCDETGLTLPVAEYGHGLGCAVVGGVVVRDPGQPLLNGRYVFSDACSGNFWLLDPQGSGRREPVLVTETGRSISSIGLDAAGLVVATDVSRGEVLRISAVAR
jgi:glucose/arabinose dehydrogenase